MLWGAPAHGGGRHRGQGEADRSFELEGNKTGRGKKLGELENHPLGSPSAKWKMGASFGLQHLGRQGRGSGGTGGLRSDADWERKEWQMQGRNTWTLVLVWPLS